MKFPNIKKACFFIIAGLLSFSNLMAQDEIPGQPKPLFQDEEILNITLEADFKKVFSVKDDSIFFPARISIADNDGQEKNIEIKIRSRGKTRRESDVCTFTPLRLEFPKKETGNTSFEGQKGIKLVTHCGNAGFYEQNTMKEYLIYKAYNVLTDSSFNVRGAMINYIYTGKKADTVRKFAFFIEREKNLADRLNGIEMESPKFNPNRLHPSQSCLMDMFQYMIGNTDYSSYDLHNIILIADTARKLQPIPVPYDFDWSGLISANYAVPHPLIGTGHVSERVYRGFKKEPFIVDQTIQIFNDKKQEIYQVFKNFALLADDEKEEVLEYLDEFYEIINNDKKVQTEFFDNARVVHE